MKSLLVRAASAAVGVAVIFSTYHFFQIKGLVFLNVLIVLFAQSEFTKIIFSDHAKNVFPYVFRVLLTLLVYFSIMTSSDYSWPINISLITVFISALIIFYGKKYDNKELLVILAKCFLGFVYLGLIPSFAIKLLLDFPTGLQWYITLLAIVFSGDIMAYLAGSLFGKHKLIPNISPKKSLEGSIGGLIGSLVAGFVCAYLFQQNNYYGHALLAVVVGFIAQWGDFFESLLKRVANVKDSGHIMPGHGGILDRIDGVLFGAPAMYLGVTLLERLSQ